MEYLIYILINSRDFSCKQTSMTSFIDEITYKQSKRRCWRQGYDASFIKNNIDYVWMLHRIACECLITSSHFLQIFIRNMTMKVLTSHEFLRRVHILYALFMCEVYINSKWSCHLYSIDFILKYYTTFIPVWCFLIWNPSNFG